MSYRNHFKFGYDGDWFRHRSNDTERFTVEFGRCARQPDSYRIECIHAAELIGETADAPIHVLYSGGVDSEVTMCSFLAADVPIQAAILRFSNNLNQHDIRYAIRFCERHEVPFRFYDLDIVNFLEYHVRDYMIPTRCTAPMTAATMWLVDQIDGYPVLGQGECFLLRPELVRPNRLPQARVTAWKDKTFTVDDWALQESEMMNAWYRHFLLRGRNGVPGFHQYTPEQMLSYLLDPAVVAMMRRNDVDSNLADKLRIYQRHFDLPPRDKYTGYERLGAIVQQHHLSLLDRFASSQNSFLLDYDSLISHLQPEV